MNHLSKQISEFGLTCVRKCWIQNSLDFTAHPEQGFYLLESPVHPGKTFPTKVFTKASDKDKFNTYIFGANEDTVEKIKAFQKQSKLKVAIIHVDVRTNSLGYALFDDLMFPQTHDGIKFPYYEHNAHLGKLVYWSSFSLLTVGMLSEEQKSELVTLRTKNKADKAQTSIFD